MVSQRATRSATIPWLFPSAHEAMSDDEAVAACKDPRRGRTGTSIQHHQQRNKWLWIALDRPDPFTDTNGGPGVQRFATRSGSLTDVQISKTN